MRRLIGGSMAIGVALALAGAAQADDMANKKGAQVSEADKSFVMDAARGGQAEVELGRLAKEKATRSDVRAFGQRMIKDHAKANGELLGIAQKVGLTAPADIADNAKAMKDKMSQASGVDFDRQYVTHMVEDHEKDIAAFEREASEGSDPGIKRFAQKTLPTLKDHLKQIREIDQKMKSAQAAQR